MPNESDWYYPPSRPREAKGGIRSQTQRGGNENWWAGRWLAVLRRLQPGGRLNRGRSYANRGQVLEINVEQGVVTAKVQGSRKRPYWVTIWLRSLSEEEKARLSLMLAERPAVVARLLGGQMPEEIDDVFRDAGCALFPEGTGDLQTECSCPDPVSPCKHVAAVYLLLGEEFDRDPFLIFRLRGVERGEIITQAGGPGEGAEEAPSGEPLPEDPTVFWEGSEPAGTNPPQGAPQPGRPASAALPRRLGHFPLWRGQERFLTALEPLYRAATRSAVEIAPGSRPVGAAPLRPDDDPDEDDAGPAQS